MMKLTLGEGYLTPHNLCLLLGPAPTGTGTIALDPTFGSFYLTRTTFTSGEPVSLVKVFRLFRLERSEQKQK